MFGQILLLMLSLTTLKAISLENTELEDCFGCLERENIACHIGSTPDEVVNQFIGEENCLYQIYMDKLQELDCIVKQNLPEDESDLDWRKAVMEIRDKFYNTTEVVDEKICNNCDKNNTFDKYVKCLKDYWTGMRTKAETEITKRTNSSTPELYTNCAILGRKHKVFC
ncbi:hypothetical protein CBL_02139 [Carabus blaptoides fortunei]